MIKLFVETLLGTVIRLFILASVSLNLLKPSGDLLWCFLGTVMQLFSPASVQCTLVHGQTCGCLTLDKSTGGLRVPWPMRAKQYNRTDLCRPITGLRIDTDRQISCNSTPMSDLYFVKGRTRIVEIIYLYMVEILYPKKAIKFNYEGGLAFKWIYKSAGPHRHPWLAAGPLEGFCSWASFPICHFLMM